MREEGRCMQVHMRLREKARFSCRQRCSIFRIHHPPTELGTGDDFKNLENCIPEKMKLRIQFALFDFGV